MYKCSDNLVAVGRAWTLGGVWRSPPLALSEFSTNPAELINMHSLASIENMLNPGTIEFRTLKTASKAQVFKAVCMAAAIKHNQVSIKESRLSGAAVVLWTCPLVKHAPVFFLRLFSIEWCVKWTSEGRFQFGSPHLMQEKN